MSITAWRASRWISIALYLHFFTVASVCRAASFTPLGALTNRSNASSGYGVSPFGKVAVVGFSSLESGGEAFRWTETEGMIGLGRLAEDYSSIAWDVSSDGSVVVGSNVNASRTEAFLWSADGGMVRILDEPTDGSISAATAVSADGLVVVGYRRVAPLNMAFRWSDAEGVIEIGDLPGGAAHSKPTGVSADGAVVVGVSGAANGDEAFLWTAERGMIGLGDFAGGFYYSRAEGVSANGSVVVGFSDSAAGPNAFRWTSDDGLVGLGDLPGGRFYSSAMAASGDGSTIVGYSESDAGWAAFVWDETYGLRNLNDVLADMGVDIGDWHLSSADAISADGRYIVGTAVYQRSLYFEAYLIDLGPSVPEPTAFSLLLTGIIPALLARLRRIVSK